MRFIDRALLPIAGGMLMVFGAFTAFFGWSQVQNLDGGATLGESLGASLTHLIGLMLLLAGLAILSGWVGYQVGRNRRS